MTDISATSASSTINASQLTADFLRTNYPVLRDSIVMLGYDIGAIGRTMDELSWIDEACKAIASDRRVTLYELYTLNAWLSTLSPEECETVTCGDGDSIAAINNLRACPKRIANAETVAEYLSDAIFDLLV